MRRVTFKTNKSTGLSRVMIGDVPYEFDNRREALDFVFWYYNFYKGRELPFD